MASSLLVLRHDDVDGAPYILAVYPSYSYDELRMRAFRIAYPGNDDLPSGLRLTQRNGDALPSLKAIAGLAERVVVLDPGPDFVDKRAKKKKGNKGSPSTSPRSSLEWERTSAGAIHAPGETLTPEPLSALRRLRLSFSSNNKKMAPNVTNAVSTSVVAATLPLSPKRTSTPPNTTGPALVETSLLSNTVVLRAGPLRKKTESSSNHKQAVARSWAGFFVVLRGRYLVFYRAEKQAAQPKPPLGAIDVLNATVAMCPEYKTRQSVFRMSVPSGTVFLFQATNEHDAEMWVAMLKTAARGGLDEKGTVAIGQEGLPSLFSGGGVILDHFINDMHKLRADGGDAPAAAPTGAATDAASPASESVPAVTTMPSMYSSEFHVYRNELFEGNDDDEAVTEGSFFDD